MSRRVSVYLLCTAAAALAERFFTLRADGMVDDAATTSSNCVACCAIRGRVLARDVSCCVAALLAGRAGVIFERVFLEMGCLLMSMTQELSELQRITQMLLIQEVKLEAEKQKERASLTVRELRPQTLALTLYVFRGTALFVRLLQCISQATSHQACSEDEVQR